MVPAALRHGNAGKRPAHALDPALAARVVAFAKDGYAGLNDSHLRDLLEDREGILLSRPSVRRILRAEGLASPRPRRASAAAASVAARRACWSSSTARGTAGSAPPSPS